MPDRTLQVWAGGDQFVFRDDEVDEALERGRDAESVPAAWDALLEYGRALQEADS